MASIEMDNERLTAEMAYQDSSSAIIKIRRGLPDFLQSVKLKYVKLGYISTWDPRSILRYGVLPALFLSVVFQLSGIRFDFDKVTELWSIRAVQLDVVTGLIGLTSLGFLLVLYWMKRPRPVFLVDFACYKPEEERKMSIESFLKMTEENGAFEEGTIHFQKRVSTRSGLGDETYFPRGITSTPPALNMKEARAEAELVMFGALDTLFKQTGIRAKDVGILVVNCSLFNPTPSLSSMIVNHYKMRTDIKSFNLGGMGCSAGLISIDLAKDLLRANANTYAIVVSMENITLNWYFGNDRSMLLCNCIFRMGGAAVLLSNKAHDRVRSKYQLVHTVRTHKGADDHSYNCVYQREDDKGTVGVSLARELMAVAGDALKTNITTLGPLVLPFSEQFFFLVTLFHGYPMRLVIMQGVLLGSKYLKTVQLLLDEAVNAGKGIKTELPQGSKYQSRIGKDSMGDDSIGEVTSGKRGAKLSTVERQELQIKKAKIISILDEVEQKYRQYHHHFEIVISSLEQAARSGSAQRNSTLAL